MNGDKNEVRLRENMIAKSPARYETHKAEHDKAQL